MSSEKNPIVTYEVNGIKHTAQGNEQIEQLAQESLTPEHNAFHQGYQQAETGSNEFTKQYTESESAAYRKGLIAGNQYRQANGETAGPEAEAVETIETSEFTHPAVERIRTMLNDLAKGYAEDSRSGQMLAQAQADLEEKLREAKNLVDTAKRSGTARSTTVETLTYFDGPHSILHYSEPGRHHASRRTLPVVNLERPEEMSAFEFQRIKDGLLRQLRVIDENQTEEEVRGQFIKESQKPQEDKFGNPVSGRGVHIDRLGFRDGFHQDIEYPIPGLDGDVLTPQDTDKLRIRLDLNVIAEIIDQAEQQAKTI